MRIAFVINEFPVISETFILDQIGGLIHRGCEVDVFAHQLFPHAATHPDVAALALMDRAFALSKRPASHRVVRVGQGLLGVAGAFLKSPRVVADALGRAWTGSGSFRLHTISQLLPFASQKPYDLVHCHFGPNGIRAVELRDLGAFKCPVVTQFHGYDASSFVREHGQSVYRELFLKGDLFLCVSERIRSRLVAWGCDASRARVHHTGVKLGQIPFLPRQYMPGRDPRLFSVSRLVEKKGLEFAVRAVAQLVRDYPRVEYTIVGDGPERQALSRLSQELGIAGNVSFLGAKTRDAVAAIMARADIMLTPSVQAKNGDEEGIPVVLMEALASGLPVVSTTHAGIPELIAHGVSGLLAPEGDAIALADQVRRLVTHPDERVAMMNEGRLTVERSFDADQLNAQLLQRYRDLLARVEI